MGEVPGDYCVGPLSTLDSIVLCTVAATLERKL
jgi:hypothetical protein